MSLAPDEKFEKADSGDFGGNFFFFFFNFNREREIERFVDCARDLFTYFFSKFNRSKKKAFYIS